MTKQDFEQAFILLLSGVVEKDGSVKWEDDEFGEVFITFPTSMPNKATVIKYWENGNKEWEEEWVKGKRHGKSLGWWENGNKSWECNWVKNQLHGKGLGWYKNGNEQWEAEYDKGQLHGKSLSWYENGNKYREEEYKNGKLIRTIK